MDEIVIKVEKLSKQYQLGVIGHGLLFRDIQSWWARVRGFEDPNLKLDFSTSERVSDQSDRFWALQDVSFEVRQGEILGIIGRNGAGKSTLLKILSRVTSPTSGSIKVKGRVASLLEVGTGFHPELTGRENIFLNGAILGMNKREIEQKFDEIVNFSEIDKFIDTPVKRYSSGMYVRLAFAVAAHLEPEILVVDEVLAVGDEQFQKKCLGKMGSVAKEGRTVLFVSHNMSAINKLCGRGFLLSNGQLIESGSIESVIKKYLNDSASSCGRILLNDVKFSGPLINKVHFQELCMYNPDDKKICNNYKPTDMIGITVKYYVVGNLKNFKVTFSLYCNGIRLLSIDDIEKEEDIQPGRYTSRVEIPGNILRPNIYWVAIGAREDGKITSWMYAENIMPFDINEIWSNEKIRKNNGLVNVIGTGQRDILLNDNENWI